MKKAFTLIEMLVVVGIIAILVGATSVAFSKVTKVAERARCQELVSNTATALAVLYQREGAWPKALIKNHNTDLGLSNKAALPLAKGGYMTLTTNNENYREGATDLAGYDRLGVVSPWAMSVMKRRGDSATLGDIVSTGGTIADHVLRYALDLDGDGVIENANVGGETVSIRATVAVWCCGKDGKIEPYSRGLKHDDSYSWSLGQTREVHK